MNPEIPNINFTIFVTDPGELKEFLSDANDEMPHR